MNGTPEAAKGMRVFVPIAAIRCSGNDTSGDERRSKTLTGRIGYYGGVLVIRYRCGHQDCKWHTDDNGIKTRVVTTHYDNIMTGERVETERMPYKGPGYNPSRHGGD